MNVDLESILRWVGVILLFAAVIRYISFYFLYFRSRRLEQSSVYRIKIGAEWFGSKVFYKIDFPVPDRLEWLKKASDGALYLSLTGILAIIFLIILQITI